MDIPEESLKELIQSGRTVASCPADGGYHVCPSGEVDPPPSGPVTENPLGSCRCDGELWIAEGCKYGFKCDSSLAIGGEYLECGEVCHSILNSFFSKDSGFKIQIT